MSLIADTGGIYALYDASDKHHAAVLQVIENERGTIIVPTTILAEIDCLLREYLGADAELDFIDSLQKGIFHLEPITPDDLTRCRELIMQYRDLNIGLADATVVATAERLNILRVLTVDERDFRAMKPRKGVFRLLPADT